MLRTLAITAAFAMAAGLASPAAAQWGFGIQVGPPRYYGPPPVYYERARPRRYYEEAPVIIAPAQPRVLHMEAPEDVLDALEDAGFRELSPMKRRGKFYVLNAVDPGGDLVALEISIFTGEIERTRVLEAAFQPPREIRRKSRPVAVAAPRPAPRAAAKAAVAPTPAAAAPRAQRAAAAARPPVRPAAPAAPAATGGGSTLRDRLQTPPEAQPEEQGSDPLVVY
jgi:hypothetical protein